jgi:hypothetical protein
MDFFFVLLMAGFAALSWGLLALCERLMREKT